jgi:hypothetical protein
VRDARVARAEHLAAEGLAHCRGPHTVLQGDLLATLRRREVDAAGTRLSAETGLPYMPAAGGEMVAGTYRQRLTLTSGRFAMIDNGLGFALVPWTPALDQHLGHHVAGVAKESGGIEWSFGRKRKLEISRAFSDWLAELVECSLRGFCRAFADTETWKIGGSNRLVGCIAQSGAADSKIRWWKHRAGSSPARGTNKYGRLN